MTDMTCANCPHMEVLRIAPLLPTPTCAKRKHCVIPHESVSESETICFWRIPKECPRDDVIKSDNKPAHKHWVTKKFSDLPVVLFDSIAEMGRYIDPQ